MTCYRRLNQLMDATILNAPEMRAGQTHLIYFPKKARNPQIFYLILKYLSAASAFSAGALLQYYFA